MSELHLIPTDPRFQNLVGRRFNKLTVIEFRGQPATTRKNFLWLCRCDCGGTSVVLGPQLKSGHTTSCGCHRAAVVKVRAITHGMSKTSEYRSWQHMLKRCTNVDCLDWPDYGGRGIRVCDRWRHSFENFIADMGRKPSKRHSIDRKDNDGNYEPGNCRWATPREQGLNKRNTMRITAEGVTLTPTEWAERKGIGIQTIAGRLSKGWPPALAVTMTGNANFTGWRHHRRSHRKPA